MFLIIAFDVLISVHVIWTMHCDVIFYIYVCWLLHVHIFDV